MSSVAPRQRHGIDHLRPYLCGGLAAVAAEMVTFPLDTAKTRQQLQGQVKNIIYRIQFDFGSVDFIDLIWQFVTHLRFVYIQKANQISIVTAGYRCEQFYTLGATTKTLPSGLLYLFLVCSYVCLTFVSDHFALLQILKQPSTCGMVCVLCITFRQFFNDY